MHLRPASLLRLAILLPLVLVACDDSSRPWSPTGPEPPSGLFTGDWTVVSVEGPGLDHHRPGETTTGIQWSVTRAGDRIHFYEDMGNWPSDGIPYEAPLEGLGFSAEYHAEGDSFAGGRFREARIKGEFAADFASFEASETLIWGPPHEEARLERTWRTRRLEN